VTLYEFMTNPDLCGSEFTGESWTAHREVLARLWDGDAHLIPPEHQGLARELLGCEELPAKRCDEMYLAFGRGSGKTRFEAVAAVHAWAEDYRNRPLKPLAAGSWAAITCSSVSTRQSGEWLDYCWGLIDKSPVLSAAVAKKTGDSIESTHFTRLEVFTSNFRTVRGFTSPLAIIDEAAYLRDEFSATPDIALRDALNPALARLEPPGRLLVASTLHRRAGLMWQMWRKYYGKVAA
jgi:hypothetical protein